MKNIIFLGILLSSVNVFAADINEQVLEQLVANAKDITLVDANTGEKLEEQLPQVLATALLQNYLNVGNTGVLSSTSVDCKNVTPRELVGATHYKCQVVIGDGDFTNTTNGLVGPDTESALVLSLDVTKVVRPGVKPTITSKKVKVVRAG